MRKKRKTTRVLTTTVFIRAVSTIVVAITLPALGDALAIVTGEVLNAAGGVLAILLILAIRTVFLLITLPL